MPAMRRSPLKIKRAKQFLRKLLQRGCRKAASFALQPDARGGIQSSIFAGGQRTARRLQHAIKPLLPTSTKRCLARGRMTTGPTIRYPAPAATPEHRPPRLARQGLKRVYNPHASQYRYPRTPGTRLRMSFLHSASYP